MNRSVLRISAAIVSLGVASSLIASPAVAAVEDGTYGIWAATDPTNAPTGSLTFGNTAVGGATYQWTNATGTSGYPYIETSSDKGDWVNASTPIGAVFGPNGPSSVENMIILDSTDPNSGTLSVTFTNAVPANYLGVAILDIDSANMDDINEADRVLVEAVANDASDLTSAELNGAVFNFCDVPVNADMPSNCSDTPDTVVPDMSEPSATSVYFTGRIADSTNIGDSAWINPTKDVKNLNITWTGNDSGSSIRVVIAVKQDPKPELPNTGFDVATGAISALVLGALGSIVLVATRRRNA